MVPSPSRVFYPVSASGNVYKLHAGEASSITAGAKFGLYTDKDLYSLFLGTATVSKVHALTADLFLEEPSTFRPSSSAYALQTWIERDHDFRLCIADNALSEAFHRVAYNLDKDRALGKRGIAFVDETHFPELVATMQDDRVVFRITDPLCVSSGLTTMPLAVECAPDRLFPIISSAADFYWHLRRTSSDKRLSSMMELECFELEETMEFNAFTLEPLLVPKSRNLVQGEIVEVEVTERKAYYGFQVRNSSSVPLYAALFYFDMSDLSISASAN